MRVISQNYAKSTLLIYNGYHQDPIFPIIILLEILTEMRAITVADGTKRTSGIDLIIFSWGTFSPALFDAMANGGVTIPVIMVASSTLLSFTFFFMKSKKIVFFFSGSLASFQCLYIACNC